MKNKNEREEEDVKRKSAIAIAEAENRMRQEGVERSKREAAVERSKREAAATRVAASYTDGGGFNNTVLSDATIAVVNVNDDPEVMVTIVTGVDKKWLQARVTDEDGITGTIYYQWTRNGTNIDGATNYIWVIDGEAGDEIAIVVRYKDDQGKDETKTLKAYDIP